jgi:hypothetical protein
MLSGSTDLAVRIRIGSKNKRFNNLLFGIPAGSCLMDVSGKVRVRAQEIEQGLTSPLSQVLCSATTAICSSRFPSLVARPPIPDLRLLLFVSPLAFRLAAARSRLPAAPGLFGQPGPLSIDYNAYFPSFWASWRNNALLDWSVNTAQSNTSNSKDGAV